MILVLGIASTGFAWISAANSHMSQGKKWEMREIMEKAKNGESLTWEEKMLLEQAQQYHSWESRMHQEGKKWREAFGKRMWLKHLTDEEKALLETLTAEEKRTFFQQKHETMKLQKEAKKRVMDTLIAGESLTASEEATRLDILAKHQDKISKMQKNMELHTVVGKLLAWDELTQDEMTLIEEMREMHMQRMWKKWNMQK